MDKNVKLPSVKITTGVNAKVISNEINGETTIRIPYLFIMGTSNV